ncbi:MAG: lysoplasmalogenase [Anaerolineales bacterium]|nr:MAG: lysoplasmalogenase [Anaerolineales bacterium]
MAFLFTAGVILAVLDWIAVAREAHRLRWFTKPGTLLALLLWFATSTPAPADLGTTWFTLALCLSLVGDIFLLMEGHQLIKGGLAFILAHVSLVIAYNLPLQIPPIFYGIFIVNMIPTVVAFRVITGAIQRQGDRDLVWGVRFYALVLTCMASTAVTTLFRSEWDGLSGWLTAVGALLFYTSNILLLFHLFVRPRQRTPLMVITSYHLAQFSLTYGYLWFLYS